MSNEDLEVEVKGEDEGDGKKHREISEWKRGYTIGYNKGRAFVWHQLGVRPSEIAAGKVKVIVGKEGRELRLGDESAETQTEPKEAKKKESDHMPLIVGIFVAAILGIVVYHFVFGKRNQPSN
jgi:hypothetical protein